MKKTDSDVSTSLAGKIPLIKDVAAKLYEIAPISDGIEGDEFDILVGNPDDEVKGIATCWSPTLHVLEQAASLGANMVISHEPLTFGICGSDPEAGLKWYDERNPTAKIPNQKRMAFALSKGISVYRFHSNWDWAEYYGVADTLARILELGDERSGARETLVFHIPETTVAELAQRAITKLNLGPSRLIGDPDRRVSRVSICQGGFGQMFTFPEVALAGGAGFAYFGEMLDYTIRYCVETGLSALELGHYQSESPGMMAMAEYLQKFVPEHIKVHHIASGEPWSYVGIR